MRSHLVRDARENILDLYELEVIRSDSGEETIVTAEWRRDRVNWLIHENRFICNASMMAQGGWRFASLAIAKLLFIRFFAGRSRSTTGRDRLIDKINSVTICIAAACLENALAEWRTGEYVFRGNFGCESNRG